MISALLKESRAESINTKSWETIKKQKFAVWSIFNRQDEGQAQNVYCTCYQKLPILHLTAVHLLLTV